MKNRVCLTCFNTPFGRYRYFKMSVWSKDVTGHILTKKWIKSRKIVTELSEYLMMSA